MFWKRFKVYAHISFALTCAWIQMMVKPKFQMLNLNGRTIKMSQNMVSSVKNSEVLPNCKKNFQMCFNTSQGVKFTGASSSSTQASEEEERDRGERFRVVHQSEPSVLCFNGLVYPLNSVDFVNSNRRRNLSICQRAKRMTGGYTARCKCHEG